MEESKFNGIFEVLDKNSNRSRNVFYFFVLINIGGFLFSLNSFVYNFPRERLKEYTQTLKCPPDNPPEHCLNNLSQVDIKIPTDKTPMQDIAIERIKHTQNSYIDEIAQTRKFTFPIFGFSVDGDYFWLTSALVGVLTLFVLASALANEAEMFSYLLTANSTVAERMRMVLATQVLTSPVDYKGEELRGIFPIIKNLMLISIIAMPVMSSLFRFLYDIRLIDVATSQETFVAAVGHLVDDFSERPVLSAVSTIIQLTSIATEVWLFIMILATLKAISVGYHDARLKVIELESAPKAPITCA